MTGVHSKVATIMKEMELGTRCGRRTMYVSCRFIASGSISVMRYNNNNNNNSSGPTRRTIGPIDAFRSHSFPTLVVGDFNIHHTLADPLRHISSNEFALSAPYFDRALDLGFTLVNTPGAYTRFPFDLTTCPSVLDLSFSNILL